jgi:hypothetical protein
LGLLGIASEKTIAKPLYGPTPASGEDPDKENWGSLKSLEKVLAAVTGEKRAHATLGPLHGIYNLRLADAHIASKDLDEAYALAQVDRALPFVMQGRDLLVTCVTSLHAIADLVK